MMMNANYLNFEFCGCPWILGDVLAVTLHAIVPQGRGVASCSPHCGQLSHLVCKPCVRAFVVEGGTITMLHGEGSTASTISFPARPMLGVVGVAPAGNDAVTTRNICFFFFFFFLSILVQ
jgi:acetamidase/formamidase